MKMSNLIASAILTAVALPVITQAAPAAVPTYTSEKCFGVAARGSNDCATATHGCAGTSVKANDAASWVYLPTGTCKKIEGGSLTAKS